MFPAVVLRESSDGGRYPQPAAGGAWCRLEAARGFHRTHAATLFALEIT